MTFYDSLRMNGKAWRKRASVSMGVDDAVKLLSSKFGRVKTSNGRNGVELTTSCPFCGKSGKLSVNPSKGVYHCWHCEASGTLSKLVGVDVKVVGAVKPVVDDRQRVVYPPSFDPSQILPLRCLPEDNPAIVYLRGRNFDPVELDETFGFRYCAVGRKFRNVPFDASNTIIIPVYSAGSFVGWQSRLLYDPKAVSEDVMEAMGYTDRKDDGTLRRPPKYLTSPGLSKADVLYNVDWAKNFDTVVVTEGVMDCVRVGKQGVATFGKHVSDNQKRMLLSLWKTIVLLLDPDASKSQTELVRDLTVPGGPRVVPVALSGYKDAGECPRDILWGQIDAALTSA